MADNLTTTTTVSTIPSGTRIATYEILSFSGDASAHIAPTVLGTIGSSEGSRTFTDIAVANPLFVRLSDGSSAITTLPVSIASTVPVTDNSGSLTVDAPVTTPVFVRLSDGGAAITTLPVSVASIPSHAVTNAGTFVVQENGAALTALQLIDNLPNTQGSTTSGQSGVLIQGSVTTASPTYTTAQTSPLSLDTSGSLRVAIVSGAGSGGTAMTDDAAFTPGSTSITPMGGTYRTSRDTLDDNDGGAIALTQRRAQLTCMETPAGDSAMDDTLDAVKVVAPRPATATLANVSTSTSSATLQASNTARLGWTCYNDASTGFLFVKFGTTASSSSLTVVIPPGGLWTDPTGYTGRIDGILSTSTGTARVTELTA